MSNVVKGIIVGIISFILSFLIFQKMNFNSIQYVFLISFNFSLIGGLFFYELLHYSIKKDGVDIKAGLFSGIVTAIILYSVIFGVELCGDFSSNELMKIKFLVLSIGYLGLGLGFLLKHLYKNEQKK